MYVAWGPYLRIHPRAIRKILPLNLLILKILPRARALVPERLALLGDLINRQDRDAEAVGLVADGELERRVDVALLLVAADVHEVLAWATIGQTVDEPGVGVEVEDDGFVVGKDGGVLGVGEAVRVVTVRDELEKC